MRGPSSAKTSEREEYSSWSRSIGREAEPGGREGGARGSRHAPATRGDLRRPPPVPTGFAKFVTVMRQGSTLRGPLARTGDRTEPGSVRPLDGPTDPPRALGNPRASSRLDPRRRRGFCIAHRQGNGRSADRVRLHRNDDRDRLQRVPGPRWRAPPGGRRGGGLPRLQLLRRCRGLEPVDGPTDLQHVHAPPGNRGHRHERLVPVRAARSRPPTASGTSAPTRSDRMDRSPSGRRVRPPRAMRSTRVRTAPRCA